MSIRQQNNIAGFNHKTRNKKNTQRASDLTYPKEYKTHWKAANNS